MKAFYCLQTLRVIKYIFLLTVDYVLVAEEKLCIGMYQTFQKITSFNQVNICFKIFSFKECLKKIVFCGGVRTIKEDLIDFVFWESCVPVNKQCGELTLSDCVFLVFLFFICFLVLISLLDTQTYSRLFSLCKFCFQTVVGLEIKVIFIRILCKMRLCCFE